VNVVKWRKSLCVKMEHGDVASICCEVVETCGDAVSTLLFFTQQDVWLLCLRAACFFELVCVHFHASQ